MNVFGKTVVLAIALIVASASLAQNHTIKILAVYEPGASIIPIPNQMANIATVFANSPPLAGNTGISYANFGFPILLTSTISGADPELQRLDARDNINLQQLRNTHAADLVVVFVSDLNGWCGNIGSEIGFNWIGFGAAMVPTLGPDLRQKDDFFIALVSTQTGCRTWGNLTAHEIGHLLGAGHEFAANQRGLLPDSYADWRKPTPGYANGKHTVMISTFQPLDCYIGQGTGCSEQKKFSDETTTTNHPSNANYKNYKAILRTKESVSMYREPPTCGLSAPVLVTGQLLDHCYGGEPTSRHRLYWSDLCPSASDNYRSWAQQPPALGTAGYDDHVETVWEPNLSHIFYVFGDAANMKVTSCSGPWCTGLSASTYHAGFEDECH